MKEMVPILDHAAQQSDRWMFIALLAIGLLAMWMLARYFARQHDVLSAKLDETNKYVRETVTNLVAKTNTALEANTAAFREIEPLLRGENGGYRK
jgi:Ca2+/H+ antiporter